jgi:hypothetical protein
MVAAGSCEACEVMTALLERVFRVFLDDLMRSLPHSSARTVTKAGNQARSG